MMAKQMTPAEYKSYLRRFNLTQKRGGEIIGIAERTSQAYAGTGATRKIPAPTAKLVRLLVKGRIVPDDIANL